MAGYECDSPAGHGRRSRLTSGLWTLGTLAGGTTAALALVGTAFAATAVVSPTAPATPAASGSPSPSPSGAGQPSVPAAPALPYPGTGPGVGEEEPERQGSAGLTAAVPGSGAPVGGPRLGESGLVLEREGGAPEPPQVRVASFLVADLDSGQILAAKAPHQRLYPASTLKVLTATALLPRLRPEQECTATAEDAAVIGSHIGVNAGQRYRASDLFNGLMQVSGNDAAYVLARCVGGVDRTIQLMQAEALRLQAYDTRVVNPCGLDEPDQLSSAYDLALFARAGMARADFRRYVGETRSTFPDASGAQAGIWNRNRLFYRYRGPATVLGVKNGYTSLGGHTLVGAARQGGRTLLVVTMKGGTDNYDAAASLLNWGFSAYDQVTPVGRLVEPNAPAAPDVAAAKPSPRPVPHRAAAAPQEQSVGLDWLARMGADWTSLLGWAGWASVVLGLLCAVLGITAFGRAVVRGLARRRARTGSATEAVTEPAEYATASASATDHP